MARIMLANRKPSVKADWSESEDIEPSRWRVEPKPTSMFISGKTKTGYRGVDSKLKITLNRTRIKITARASCT